MDETNDCNASPTQQHCWHSDGTVLTTWPPIYPETCCWCGAMKNHRERIEDGQHGEHKPRLGWFTVQRTASDA